MTIDVSELRLTLDQARYLSMVSPTQRRKWAVRVLSTQALEDRCVELPDPQEHMNLNDAIASGDKEIACELLAMEMDRQTDA